LDGEETGRTPASMSTARQCGHWNGRAMADSATPNDQPHCEQEFWIMWPRSRNPTLTAPFLRNEPDPLQLDRVDLDISFGLGIIPVQSQLTRQLQYDRENH
jgi:hypothetical protein